MMAAVRLPVLALIFSLLLILLAPSCQDRPTYLGPDPAETLCRFRVEGKLSVNTYTLT
jgi:hypothetical protein